MFLKSISTEELNFEKSWNLGLKKIKREVFSVNGEIYSFGYL